MKTQFEILIILIDANVEQIWSTLNFNPHAFVYPKEKEDSIEFLCDGGQTKIFVANFRI